MTTHKKLSPSKFIRARLCAASVREEANYPDEGTSNPAAIDGTHDHTLLETCVDNNMANPYEYVDKTLKDHEGEFVVNLARADRVVVAIRYIDKRIEELGENTKVYSEVKLDSSQAFGRDDMGGTSDIVICGGDTVEILDYKGGMGQIDLPCDQTDIYTLMVLGQFEEGRFKNVRQTIVQPKLNYRGENGVVWVDMTVEEMLAKRQMYIDAAAATDDPNAPHVPGDKQCQWCKHKGACSTLVTQNMEALGIDFSKMNVVQDAVDKEPSTMSDDQIKELIEAAPLIRQMLEAVEKEALSRLEAGKQISGLKLVKGRGSRAWAYDDAVMEEKLKKFGLTKDVLWKTSLISPAQAEKVTWKKRDGTVKQLTEKQLKMLHDEYITKSDGKLQVAPESDSRPAVVRDVSAMFAPVVTVPELPAFLQVPDWLK